MGACLSKSGADDAPMPPAPERRLSSYATKSGGGGKAAWGVVWAGTFTIGAERGAAAVEAAVKLWEASEKAKDVKATVRMDSHSLKVIENAHGNNVETHFIRSISSTAIYGEGGTKFVGLVCKHPSLGIRTCTLFKCGDGTADDMARSIQDVFQVLIKAGNPFAAPDGQELIRPPETLANEEIRRHFLASAGVVGAGQFGEVHLAKLSLKYGTPKHQPEEGHIMVAVKMLKLSAPAEDRTEFIRECEAMLHISHPNLLTMHGVSVRRRPWLCIVELVAYGDMLSIVKASKTKDIELSYPEQLRIVAQAAEGMAHMARSGYVHMDLAARNLLLGKGLVCKVADFGLTRTVNPQTKMFVQTEQMKVPMKWMSPESMDSRLWSEKSDVWSFAVTMWEIFTYGEVPFGQFINKDVQLKVRGGLRLKQPDDCPDEMYALMIQCWDQNYITRPPFQKVSDALHRMLDVLEPVRQQMPERDVGALLAGAAETPPAFYGKSVPKGVPLPNYNVAPSTIVVNPAFLSPEKAEMNSKKKKKKKKKKEDSASSEPKEEPTADGLTESDIGCKVRVVGIEDLGVLRFVGPHHEAGSERYGIEFATPVGKNNGTVKGHVYFTCEKLHGQLCMPKKVSRATGPLAGQLCKSRAAPKKKSKKPKMPAVDSGPGAGVTAAAATAGPADTGSSSRGALSFHAGTTARTSPATPAPNSFASAGGDWEGAGAALASASGSSSAGGETEADLMDRMMSEMGMPVGDSADA
eukprot:gene2104-6210_t